MYCRLRGFILALKAWNADLASKLISSGVDVNYRRLDVDECTLLERACSWENTTNEDVQLLLLLAAGAKSSPEALLRSVGRVDTAITETLLTVGTSINDFLEGRTVLSWLINKPHNSWDRLTDTKRQEKIKFLEGLGAKA